MANKDTAKTYFQTGDKPSQSQFYQTFDWLRWADDTIAIADVTGLTAALALKADQASLAALINILFPFKVLLTANGSYTIPAGMIVEKIILTPAATATLKIGTTNGGEEIMIADTVAGGADKSVTVDIIARADTIIYFTGLVGSTTILIYRKTLTSSN